MSSIWKKIIVLILKSFDWDALVRLALKKVEEEILEETGIAVDLDQMDLDKLFAKIETALKEKYGIEVDLDDSGSVG